jgi:hypothetical protein
MNDHEAGRSDAYERLIRGELGLEAYLEDAMEGLVATLADRLQAARETPENRQRAEELLREMGTTKEELWKTLVDQLPPATERDRNS